MRKINKQRLRGASFEDGGGVGSHYKTAAATKKAPILCLSLVAGRCFDVGMQQTTLVANTTHTCDVDEAVNSSFEAQAAQEKESCIYRWGCAVFKKHAAGYKGAARIFLEASFLMRCLLITIAERARPCSLCWRK